MKYHVRAFTIKGGEVLGNCDYQGILRCKQYRRTKHYKLLQEGLRSTTIYKWQIDSYDGSHNYETVVNKQYIKQDKQDG